MLPNLLVDFHGLTIRLSSNDERVLRHWRELFDYEIVCQVKSSEHNECIVQLDVHVVSRLPPTPSLAPDYVNHAPPLKVYNTDRRAPLVRLSDVGQITWRIPQGPARCPEHAYAEAVITAGAFEVIALDNLTTLSLAPILRIHDLFVIHAFAATEADRAVMLVGPSGSGKTSSGLSLIAGGWQLLANDMAFMRAGETAHALLSPGSLQISPTTGSLLPQFVPLLERYTHLRHQEKVTVPRLEFLPCGDANLSAPLKTIFFPQVTERAEHHVERVSRAVGLARLMEFSMDQWDRDRWEEHVAFLEHLSQQVEFYWLYLGRNMADLPHSIAAATASG